MTGKSYQQLLVAYLLAVILAQIIFAAFPQIDLAVSHLFARGAEGFPWADGPPIWINLVIRQIGEALVVILVAGCVIGALTGRLGGPDLRAWGYPALCVVLSSGALVNLLLKTHVGRARPADIAEFGGEATFSPAWQVVRQCPDNCSFASGEVALAAGFAITAVVLLWPQMGSRRARLFAILVAAAYVVVVALLRIGLGRHFLSDAVFSVLFSAGVALVLYPLMRIEQARLGFSPMTPIAVGRKWIADWQARASVMRKRVP
ncbi:phosphatase PAP2 family protein [Tabrizicola sp.]|uniref:phosphatase PAP2 family protein n=1 Tax=Tabrizicola sp. TaxID=2005166 RepID=UPI003F390211